MADISPTLGLIDSALSAPPTGDAPAAPSAADQTIDMLQAGIDGKIKPASQSYETTAKSLILNAEAGPNEVIANTLGAPVDLVSAGLRKVGVPIPEAPFGGSESIKRGMGLINANPENVVPQNLAEKTVRGIASGATEAMLMPIGGEVLAAGKVISPAAAEATRAALGAPDVLNATIGGASGAGSTIAQEAVPEPYKPIAGMAGGLVGGLPVVAAHAVGTGLVEGGKAVLDRATEAGAKRTVGREMANAATDQAAARENLATQPHEIVPGSIGTTAQIAGDQGLLGWERGIRQANAPEFNAREADQNAARVAQLESVQPTGNALELPEAVRAQRAAVEVQADKNIAGVDQATKANSDFVDAVTAAKAQRAQQAYDTALEALRTAKPDGSPADLASHFRNLREAVDQQAENEVSAAQKVAGTVQSAIAPRAQSAEQVGTAMRGPAQEALTAAKARIDDLYKAVDPNGTMTVPGSAIAQKAVALKKGLLPENTPMEGEEARLNDLASKYTDQTPFKNATALRSSILSEMANVRRTNPQAYGRLDQLRQAVDSAIDHGVENQAALDSVAVRRGTMTAEDSLPVRVNREIDAQQPIQATLGSDSRGNGGSAGRSAGGNVVSPTGGGEANVGPGNAAGGEGLSEAPGAAKTSAAGTGAQEPGVEPLREANKAYREMKETFAEGPVGDILEKKPRGNEFERSNAEVARKVFHPGDTGGEDVRAYVKAVGPEVAHPVLQDAAAFSLHQKAVKPDGTFDAAVATKWIADHKAALDELPANIRSNFSTATKAQEAVTEALAKQRDRLNEFDKSEAGKVAGLSANGDIVSHVGSILDSKTAPEKRIAELAQAAKSSPAAQDGIKRAVVEHVMDKFVPETGAVKPEKLQAYIADKKDVLSKVLSKDEIAALDKKAADVLTTERVAGEAKATREQAVKQAEGERKEALKQAESEKAEKLSKYDRGVLGQLKGVSTTGDVLNVIKGIFAAKDGAAKMAELAKEAEKVPGATEALKRAVQEHMQREFTSTSEAATSGSLDLKRAAFQKFMNDKTDALKAAGLSDEQIGKLNAIVQDGLRANRSITATKLKGGSDTNQNMLSNVGKSSIITKLAMQATGAVGGSIFGGAGGGVIGWLGSKAVGALREAGLDKVNKIRVQAALDPQFGKALLDDVPKYPDRNAAALIALRARQLSVASALAGTRH